MPASIPDAAGFFKIRANVLSDADTAEFIVWLNALMLMKDTALLAPLLVLSTKKSVKPLAFCASVGCKSAPVTKPVVAVSAVLSPRAERCKSKPGSLDLARTRPKPARTAIPVQNYPEWRQRQRVRTSVRAVR